MTHDGDTSPQSIRAQIPFECIALVLQGGGALGAYQAGVFQALDEAGIEPDWIAGISIGAFNSAIIAGNPPGQRVARLREFWERITEPYVRPNGPPPSSPAQAEAAAAAPESTSFWMTASRWIPAMTLDSTRALLNQWSAGRVLFNGTPGFFSLRPVTPWLCPAGSTGAGESVSDRHPKRLTK